MKTLHLLAVTGLLVNAFTSTAQNWDGDDANGNFSMLTNWVGNALPAWLPTTDLQFQLRSNPGQTSLFHNLGWQPVRSILYASTFPVPRVLQADAVSGFDFYDRIQNNSTISQVITAPLSFKGTTMQLNPSAGNLVINSVINNDDNRNINVYGNAAGILSLDQYPRGNASVSLTIMDNNYSVVAIGYNNVASFGGGVTIQTGELWIRAGAVVNGGTIRVGNGSGRICKLYASDPSVSTTIDNPLLVPALSTQSFIGGLNTSNKHLFTGDVNLQGDVALDAVNTGGTIEFSGSIYNGPGRLTKIGPGTVVLSGTNDNTFNGGTVISGGTLVLAKTNGLRALGSGSVTIGAGTILRTNNANQWGTGLPPLVTINDDGIFDLNNQPQQIAVTSASATAALQLGSALATINRATSNAFAGVISGTGGIIKTNTGTWTLTGTNTYTGLTTISAGGLRLSKVAGNTLPGTNDVQLTGTGTLMIATSQTIRNFTMVTGTTLVVEAGATLRINGSYNATGGAIDNRGTIILGGNNVNFPGTGVIVNNGTAGTMNQLEIAVSGTVTLSTSFALTGNIVLTSGVLNAGNSNLTITLQSNWTNNGGTFSPGNSTVLFSRAGSQEINGTVPVQVFNHLVVAKPSGTLGLQGSTTTLVTIGALQIISGVLNGGSHLFRVGGNWINYDRIGFNEQSSIVEMEGGGAQTINTTGGEVFYVLKKTGPGTLTLASAVSIQGTGAGLLVTGGVVNAGNHSLSGTLSATLEMTGGLIQLARIGTVLPEFPITAYQLSGNSAIELNGAGNQQLRGDRQYAGLHFSNAGTKTITTGIPTINGTVYITGNATVDIMSNIFGGITTRLTMDGGRFRMAGATQKPDMEDVYTLTGGTIEFYHSGTVGSQTINGQYGAGSPIVYHRVEITGNRVGNSNTNITLGNGGSFTVKNGGIFEINDESITGLPNGIETVVVEDGGVFRTGDKDGFSGSGGINASSVNLAIDTVRLQNGSTVEYVRNDLQTITNAHPYSHLFISGNAGLKSAPAGQMVINGNFSKTGSSVFEANGGMVIFNGTTAQQTFSNSSGTRVDFYQLVNNNPFAPGLNITGNLGIIHSLQLGNNSVTTLANGDITLLSSPTITARVAAVPATALINYTGSGRFKVERFFRATRAWRLVTSPLSSDNTPTTIFSEWQEGGVYLAGRGTLITGPSPSPANGLDNSTLNNFSLKKFVNNNYVDIGNTKVPLTAATTTAANTGFFLFVRGDRNPANTFFPNTNATVLSSSGKLQRGSQLFPGLTRTIAGTARLYQLVGNPYASPVNFDLLTRSNLLKRFIVWDPGLNTVGGFITFDDPDDDGVYSQSAMSPGLQDTIIQSGQAFFVETAAAVGIATLRFEESHKSIASQQGMFRPLKPAVSLPTVQIRLMAGGGSDDGKLLDGTLVEYNDNFSASNDLSDALKFLNINETLGLKRQGAYLSIERRPKITTADTLFPELLKLIPRDYRLQLETAQLDPLITAQLQDAYTGNTIPLNLSQPTEYRFSVTGDPGSAAPARFRILFSNLPLTALTGDEIALQAVVQQHHIYLQWKVYNTPAIDYFLIEKSIDGFNFQPVHQQAAASDTIYKWLHEWVGSGDHYYRLRCYLQAGGVRISRTARVRVGKRLPQITCSPNPVNGHQVNITLQHLDAGTYQVQLLDASGKLHWKHSLYHNGEQVVTSIYFKRQPAKGYYILQLLDRKQAVKTASQLLFE